MTSNHHLDHVDLSKDYYQTLGMPHTATVDELKAAYVNLVMQYHPDTMSTKAVDDNTKKAHQSQFVRVAEAYSVLSRPESKAFYDTGRSRLLGKSVGSVSAVQASASAAPEDFGIISEAYNTQRNNFTKVQGRASSNWRDLQEKYKTEKWQNMPLQQRKLNRSAKVHGVGSTALVTLAPVVFLAGLAYHFMSS